MVDYFFEDGAEVKRWEYRFISGGLLMSLCPFFTYEPIAVGVFFIGCILFVYSVMEE